MESAKSVVNDLLDNHAPLRYTILLNDKTAKLRLTLTVRPLDTLMFIKTRTITILTAVLIVLVGAAMSAEWKFAVFMIKGSTIHNYHGICNGGVGQPYQDFIHQLRTMAESGDTNRLTTVLRRADERSRDIYDVWLDDFDPHHDAHRKSVEQILK